MSRDPHARAAGPGGYFTAEQARAAGYGYPHLTYHLRSGTFERVGPGPYRPADVPVGDHDDLVRPALLARRVVELGWCRRSAPRRSGRRLGTLPK